ncbi:hypothetical protein, partial [Erwinia sp. V71]|uniref:hypothetical protein n=1 Tax=Erwinia sp. V71 TaxID=3369424 RepID=UPI003F60F9BE
KPHQSLPSIIQRAKSTTTLSLRHDQKWFSDIYGFPPFYSCHSPVMMPILRTGLTIRGMHPGFIPLICRLYSTLNWTASGPVKGQK